LSYGARPVSKFDLLPHIERACESSPLQLLGTSMSADGAFELRLTCTQPDASVGEVRAAVFAVLVGVAEADAR